MKTFFSLLTLVFLCTLPRVGHAQDPADACLTHAPHFDTTTRLGRGEIYDLALSPDGRMVAAASGTGLWLYDAATLQDIAQLKAPVEAAETMAPPDGYVPVSVAWSPDGKQLVAGYYDGVRIWEIGTGAVIRTLGAMPSVTHVAWSPDGARLAIITLAEISPYPDATEYYDVLVFEFDNSLLTTVASRVIRNPDAAVWSPDGQQLLYVASYSYRPDEDIMDYVPALGAAVIWNSTDDSRVTLTPTNADGYFDVHAVAWSPDATTLALAAEIGENDRRQEVQLWDVTTGSMVNSLPAQVEQLAWSGDGATLLIAHQIDLTLVTGSNTTTLTVDGRITAVAVNADASRLVVFRGADLQVIDTATQQGVVANTAHSGVYFFPAWSADGQLVALTQLVPDDETRRVSIYDTNGQLVDTFTINGTPLSMAWSPDNAAMAVALPKQLVLINLATKQLTTLEVDSISGLAWSPDGSQLAYITDAGDVTVLTLAASTTQTFPSAVEGLDGTTAYLDSRVAWPTAGLRWILGDMGRIFRVFGPNWDTSETVLLAEIGWLKAISLGTAPEIMADGNVLYIPSDGDMAAFDVPSASTRATYPTPFEEVRWSMGGGCYGVNANGFMWLYSTATGDELQIMALPVAPVWGLYGGIFWSPTGTHVITLLGDGTALIWGIAE